MLLEVLILGSIALFGFLIAVSATKLRAARSPRYWAAPLVWSAVIALTFTVGGRGSEVRDNLLAAALLGAFPVFVVFAVARLTKSGFWISTALATASWAASVFAGLSFGISMGLIRK